MYKLSVIIPFYNRADELDLTLKSLQDQTIDKAEFEVVIADDGSCVSILDLINGYPELNITYCRQDDLGFRVAAVRNLGLKHANGEIVVFNDNGLLLSRNTLEKHISYHKKASNLVLLGNMYATGWGSDMDKVLELLSTLSVDEAIAKMKEIGGMGDGRSGYLSRFGEDVDSWYIPWLALWGGHLSVKKAFLKEHGILFDENFTSWGGEDNDFGIQLCNAGARYLFAPDLEVVHFPTPNRDNADSSTPDFKENYKRVKSYIANKHNTEATEVWLHLGAGSNDPVQRAEYLKSRS